MEQPTEKAKQAQPQRPKGEYDDPHYHDDEGLPSDEREGHGPRPPVRRKPIRRPSPRRYFPED